MERYRPSAGLFEPAIYRICKQSTLQKQWSDYYSGMTIEHASEPKRGAKSILSGRLLDQVALMGILNALYDLGYPILSIEYRETE